MAPLDSVVLFWPNLSRCELDIVPEEPSSFRKELKKKSAQVISALDLSFLTFNDGHIRLHTALGIQVTGLVG
jgi:hypothetical protein